MLRSWRSYERDTRSYSLGDLPYPTNPSPYLPIPPSSIRGRALEKEFLDLLQKRAIEQAPQTPGFYSRLFVVQKDSGSWRPIIDLSTLNTLSCHNASIWRPPSRPTLHSSGRLDDLTGPSGGVPSGSNPPGITSVSPLHHGRSSIPVQGIVFRANNCPLGLYKGHGSNIRHSPSLRYQNAPISRRLVDLSQVQGRLYSSEGQAPTSVRELGLRVNHDVITGSISNHDLPKNADLISSVHCETNRDKGNEPPQHNRGVSLVPEPPQQLSGDVFWATFRTSPF